MFRTYDYYCPSCGYDKIVMMEKDSDETIICHHCDTEMKRGFPAPTVLRASFAEGQSRGERWALAKESAKLEQDASRVRKNGDANTASEMRKEARKIVTKMDGKRDKTDK